MSLVVMVTWIMLPFTRYLEFKAHKEYYSNVRENGLSRTSDFFGVKTEM